MAKGVMEADLPVILLQLDNPTRVQNMFLDSPTRVQNIFL